jgi:uncharacterized NAD-dependent epimerase/dehydratase family protein
MSHPDRFPEGNAIVYCDGFLGTPNGKTAHGLVRGTRRYRVLSVLDRRYAGRDAGEVLDGRPAGIPVLPDLAAALGSASASGANPTHFVFGVAPDGGRLAGEARGAVVEALLAGLNVDSGLHDFLSEDPELAALAARSGAAIRDVRKPPERKSLHFFSRKIEEVDSLKIAFLGTDSAVGKRTTARILETALNASGIRAEMIGTGQTAWMQGVRYGIVLDALVNDFVAGELEHAVHQAWKELHPDAILIEGQGSLLNPAFPGGLEILAATRPDLMILQHAPARKDYDGFPGYPIHPIEKQIRALEMLSDKPVVALTLNPEDLKPEEIPGVCRKLEAETGKPVFDVLHDGAEGLAALLAGYLPERNKPARTA